MGMQQSSDARRRWRAMLTAGLTAAAALIAGCGEIITTDDPDNGPVIGGSPRPYGRIPGDAESLTGGNGKLRVRAPADGRVWVGNDDRRYEIVSTTVRRNKEIVVDVKGDQISVDGEVVNDVDSRVLMVAVGNGSTVGGGAALTPDADPRDGVIDVMISHAVGPLARLQYAARLGRGSHEERHDVVSVRGREVTVSGEEFWCSADGEISGPERHRTWHVEPAAYAMVLPAPGGDQRDA